MVKEETKSVPRVSRGGEIPGFLFFRCALSGARTDRCYHPTNIGVIRGTLSVAILVVVSNGLAMWVALRFLYDLYAVRNATSGVVRNTVECIVKKKTLK